MTKEHFELTHEFKNAEVRSVELLDGSFTKGDKLVEWKYYKLMIEEEKTANRIYLIDNNTEEGRYKKGQIGNFVVKIDFSSSERGNLYMSKLRVLSFRPRKR